MTEPDRYDVDGPTYLRDSLWPGEALWLQRGGLVLIVLAIVLLATGVGFVAGWL